jgi:WD40 repeat protein
MLATGSHDNIVYVYDVKKNYQLICKFNKHTSFVTALDWSKDQTYIRSNCGSYEKLYFNIVDKSQDASGVSNTKGMEWESGSLKIGWDVEGIFPSGEDGSHINGVDVSQDMTHLATGDDFGLMNVYRYPCMGLKHKARSYCGHSEHVVRTIFSKDGDRIFSIGGYDKTVI